MRLNKKFHKVFEKLPVLGMIHLAGSSPVKRALKELAVFEEEGIDGAIIENYHGSVDDIVKTLEETAKLESKLVIGVNVLPNEYHRSFVLAKEYNSDFIQLDYVAGRYTSGGLPFGSYANIKECFPNIIVLGGVWPKYYQPVEGSILGDDLKTGMERAEAIVVTGAGTGKETPIEKIKSFRKVLGEHPLIVGSGLTPENAFEQLCLADGAIVGSSLKVGNKTCNRLDRLKIRDFMFVVKEARDRKG